MALTTAKLQTLATELQTDPRGYGYAADLTSGNDAGLRDKLNTVRNGTNPPTNPTGAGGQADGHIDVKRDDVAARDVVVAVDLADMPSLPQNPNSSQLSSERRSLAYLQMLSCMEGTIRLVNDDGTNTPVISNVAGIFTAGSATLTRLNSLRFRFGSRAEELLGRNTAVTDLDVAAAKKLIP